MKKIITSFLFISAFLGKTVACDCIPVSSFCESITFENEGAILDFVNIYHVKFTEETTSGITASVIKSYHGADITGQDIFIGDGDGADCRLFATFHFDAGDEAIIVSAKYDTTSWYISECGINFLKIINGQVTGEFSPGVNQIPLDDFQAALAGCANPNQTEETQRPAFSVTPTLAQDLVSIRTNRPVSADIELSVFDAAGRQVHSAILPKEDLAQPINISDWNNGIYFFRINSAGGEQIVKLVKMD